MECLHCDYCPCELCDDVFVKEDYFIGKRVKIKLQRIKGTVSDRHKKRVELIPHDVKVVYYAALDEGKTIGEARKIAGIGLGAAGELCMQAINTYNFYSNPTKE